MSKFHISLRVKLTAIVTGVMAVCCFFLQRFPYLLLLKW